MAVPANARVTELGVEAATSLVTARVTELGVESAAFSVNARVTELGVEAALFSVKSRVTELGVEVAVLSRIDFSAGGPLVLSPDSFEVQQGLGLEAAELLISPASFATSEGDSIDFDAAELLFSPDSFTQGGVSHVEFSAANIVINGAFAAGVVSVPLVGGASLMIPNRYRRGGGTRGPF